MNIQTISSPFQHSGIMLFCLVLPWKSGTTPELLARLSGGDPTPHHCHSHTPARAGLAFWASSAKTPPYTCWWQTTLHPSGSTPSVNINSCPQAVLRESPRHRTTPASLSSAFRLYSPGGAFWRDYSFQSRCPLDQMIFWDLFQAELFQN